MQQTLDVDFLKVFSCMLTFGFCLIQLFHIRPGRKGEALWIAAVDVLHALPVAKLTALLSIKCCVLLYMTRVMCAGLDVCTEK